MSRAVAIHAALLAAALAGAFAVWTREPPTGSGGELSSVPLVSMRGELQRLVWKEKSRTVEITRKKDARGAYHWIQVTTVTEVPEPAASQPASRPASQPAEGEGAKAEGAKGAKGAPASRPAVKEPPAKKVTRVQAFKGNLAADELMKEMARLPAARRLGKVDAKKLKAFGLAGETTRLTLTGGGRTRKLAIGGNTYGSSDYYVRDLDDGVVYVVRPRLLDDLIYAESRLVDRSLVSAPVTDLDRLVLQAGGKRVTLVQRNRRDPATAFWTPEGKARKGSAAYGTWVGKLIRLRALDYVRPEDRPKKLEDVFEATFYLGDRQKGRVVLRRQPVPKPSGESKAAPPLPAYYAESDNTRALVSVPPSLADELARDLKTVLGR